jgi:hypothetical protein
VGKGGRRRSKKIEEDGSQEKGKGKLWNHKKITTCEWPIKLIGKKRIGIIHFFPFFFF